MLASYRSLILASVVLLSVTACNKDGKVNSTAQITADWMDKHMADYGSHMDQMADNAMLHNMTVNDYHFVAHSAELSGTGASTLDRLTPYLSTYGGLVAYETYMTDETLIEERIDHVREYLALAGCEMERVEVEHGMVRGRTIPARDAMAIREAGTATNDSPDMSVAGAGPAGGQATQPSRN